MTKLLYIGPHENVEVLKHALEDSGRILEVIHAEKGVDGIRLVEKGGIAIALCIWRDSGAGAGKAFIAAMLRHHATVPTVAIINSKILWNLQVSKHPGMAQLPVTLIEDTKLDFVRILKKKIMPVLMEKLPKTVRSGIQPHAHKEPIRERAHKHHSEGSYKGYRVG